MDLFRWAVTLQVLLLIYFESITLVNLYPWNDLSNYTFKEKVIEATTNGIVITLALGLFFTQIKGLMILSVMIWFVFLLMQLLVWWMPYVTGRHLKQFPMALYHTHFQATLKILPPIKNHIVPDAQHNVLQLISLVTFLVSTIALLH